LATAERSDSGARHKALYLNLLYRKRLAYGIGWARLDAFCLVPLSLRSIWRRRVAPNLNQKVENATLKNYSELTRMCVVAYLRRLESFAFLQFSRSRFLLRVTLPWFNFALRHTNVQVRLNSVRCFVPRSAAAMFGCPYD